MSPGGPLGSSYELISSGPGPKVLYRGNPSLAARGYSIGPWARKVVGLLQKNWQLPTLDQGKSVGRVGITVVVERSGTLSTVRLVDSPNDQTLVRAALNAITHSLPLPQLPDDYPGLSLEAYLLFDYHEAR
jgi:outer membrane biosynthesis protein TonB